LEHPFNLWSEKHVQQGFSWRPGSVSFATLEEAAQYTIDVDVTSDDVALSSEAIRVIETPFEVPQNGAIEIASISDSIPLDLASGPYALRFECFAAVADDNPKIRFVFIRKDKPSFQILRADDAIAGHGDLLLSASPA